MKIRILDRYVFTEVAATFLFGICAFSAVFIGSGTLFRIARLITDYGASFASVIKVFVFSLPGVVQWTFPMSMLLASLMTFGRLSGTSEITAMKSCGISFYRIASPAIVLGFAVSIFAIWFNENVVPAANNAYRNVVYYEIQGNTAPASQDHIIIKEITGNHIQRLIYARRFDGKKQRMEGITMQLFEKGELSYVENAQYADWDGGAWTMHNGIIYEVIEGEKGKSSRFKSQFLPINRSPREIVREQKRPDELTANELKEQIKVLRDQFVNTAKLESELHQRYTVPMASLIFAVIGVPLGMQPNRHSSSAGFAVSIIIIFIYYAGMTMASALARGGAMNPMLAVWLPNIVSAVVGVMLMRRAAR